MRGCKSTGIASTSCGDSRGNDHRYADEEVPRCRWASEPIFLVRCTDVGDLGHQVIENCNAHKGRYENGGHLRVECYPRWDMGGAVRKPEILSEVGSVRGRHVPAAHE